MRHNQGQNQKRSRGRGRRSNNHGQTNFNRNTTFDSNGPEGRLRGNALQLFEKYTALAHDANAAGERISAEALAQFADHYYRIHQTIVQAAEQNRRSHEERQQARSKTDDTAATDKAADQAAETGQTDQPSETEDSQSPAAGAQDGTAKSRPAKRGRARTAEKTDSSAAADKAEDSADDGSADEAVA